MKAHDLLGCIICLGKKSFITGCCLSLPAQKPIREGTAHACSCYLYLLQESRCLGMLVQTACRRASPANWPPQIARDRQQVSAAFGYLPGTPRCRAHHGGRRLTKRPVGTCAPGITDSRACASAAAHARAETVRAPRSAADRENTCGGSGGATAVGRGCKTFRT
eukprot:361064-Chlamydomonas_euryale.AAC.12